MTKDKLQDVCICLTPYLFLNQIITPTKCTGLCKLNVKFPEESDKFDEE
jgi:hypothetical protein